jgi:hypothetical protein
VGTDPQQQHPHDPGGRARATATRLILEAADSPGSRQIADTIGDLVMFGATFGTAADFPARVATDLLVDGIARGYESGWQPADLVHVAARLSKSGKIAAVVSAAVGIEAGLSGAATRAPEEWRAQVPAAMPVLAAGGANPWDGWESVLGAIRVLRTLRTLDRLVPPPSQWAAVRVTAPAAAAHPAVDPKKLATVRNLLAKAEATDFAPEAETFTEKAQALMTRYAIDEALLAAPQDRLDVRARRVHLLDPYSAEKATLLHVCAEANHSRSILHADYGIATIVGPPLQLDLTEMLFTSLLVQAVKAMTESGHRHRGDRSPSFRRAFLISYAQRIGERLADTSLRVQSEAGAELVPVLARTKAAVDDEFTRLFPHTTTGRSRSYDARGWHAGTEAADRASLARGQVARR